MNDQTPTISTELETTERIESGNRGPMRGFGGGMVGQKASAFGPSARRLAGRLGPQRLSLGTSVAAAFISVAAASQGPRALGWATDVIFDGIIGGLGGDTDEGSGRAAGIDFDRLRFVLLIAVGLYVVSAIFGFVQGYLLNEAVQRTIQVMRSEVESKLNRLPLRYFDRQPRGELLSRVTNDMD
ncbi:MAG: ABC transporter transmembrane domain-containing protein, partial [Acidimicrobiia bacterium]|nr:ABC transporter transmembrane domain-containing protein [Acidimicrobiia bacterium]